jgi:hypothetical protein
VPGGIITMTKLGRMGRFANQLVQYMFLKTYAQQYGLRLETPRWIGQELFGLDDPPISQALPEFVELYDKDPRRMVVPRLAEPLSNVDFCGFFQYPTRYYAPHKECIRQWFTPVPAIRQPLDEAVARLRERGRTVVGMHIRRGDYGYAYFYLTPLAWYLRWLERTWAQLDDPVLLVASDELDSVLPALADYHPVAARNLGVGLAQAPDYPDFYLLSQADVLVIPNSTFSFVASMLGQNLRQAYRSHLSDPLDDPPFRRFDPWDADMLDCQADVQRFGHIPGIAKPPPRGFWRMGWLLNRRRRV